MTGLLSGLMIRLILILVFGVLIVGGYFGITFALDAPIRQGQDAALNRYGAAAVKLCNLSSDQNKIGKATIEKGAKLGVIKAEDGTFYERYANVLPAARQAMNASETAVILCLQESQTDLEPDTYGSKTSSTRYSCYRKERDLSAYLIDVKTGTQFASQDFPGAEPGTDACPEKTDKDLTVYGELPSTVKVINWAIKQSGS